MEDAIDNKRYGYENMFDSAVPFFTPSAFFASDTNFHDDLDNIFRGNFLNQLDSFGRISTGSGSDAWGGQGTSYSPYPDPANTFGTQENQDLWGAEVADTITVSEKAPEINGVQYSEEQANVDSTPCPARISENGPQGELPTKREPDTTLDAAAAKPKKKRGPRKRKEISTAEKKAKEEKKLERNRLAAGKCREKKKQETAGRIEEFNELEHQNQFLQASLEQLTHERNEVITLLIQHRECGYASIDECMKPLLQRVAAEAPIPYDGVVLARSSSQSSQASTMSRSDASTAASQSSYYPGYALGAQSWNSTQSWTRNRWQESLDSAYHQSTSRKRSNQSHKASSSEGTSAASISRRDSILSTEHGAHRRSDSSLSSPGTSIEARKK